jgi:hypothetical protein
MEPGYMPLLVPLPKATVPMGKCQIGIPATQAIPQPQEHIQVRCTRLQRSTQHQGAFLMPHLLLRLSMQPQGASLPLLLLRRTSCMLRSRCRLSISLDRQAHLEPANNHHHHRTTIS